MSYGLTPAGFSFMTAPVILDELASTLKARPGMADMRTGTESKFTNLATPFSEQVARVWDVLQGLYHSLNPLSASGVSLDARGQGLGKGRYFQRRSTVLLTLYNRSKGYPIEVLAYNQARQSATGVLWETLSDVIIPALTTLHTGLDVNNQTWQSGTTVRITFANTPALGDVAIGDRITISGSTNPDHNGTFTLTDVNVNAFWVEVSNPLRTSGTGNETGSPAQATIVDTETSVTVAAQAVEYGPFEASAGTINETNTPVSGWDGVANLAEAAPGRLTESDTDFRRRLLASAVIALGGVRPAIIDRLLEVPGVTYATVEENDGDTELDGMTPHSIRATVVGGTDQAVIDALGKAKGAGIGTNGTVTGYYTNAQGYQKLIRLNRVTKLVPWIIVEITAGPNFPMDLITGTLQLQAEAEIQTALEALYFTHGQTLLMHRLRAAVSDLGLADVLDVVVYADLVDTTPSTTTNLTALTTEQFDLDKNRISLVLL